MDVETGLDVRTNILPIAPRETAEEIKTRRTWETRHFDKGHTTKESMITPLLFNLPSEPDFPEDISNRPPFDLSAELMEFFVYTPGRLLSIGHPELRYLLLVFMIAGILYSVSGLVIYAFWRKFYSHAVLVPPRPSIISELFVLFLVTWAFYILCVDPRILVSIIFQYPLVTDIISEIRIHPGEVRSMTKRILLGTTLFMICLWVPYGFLFLLNSSWAKATSQKYRSWRIYTLRRYLNVELRWF
jgi:hypothetical protein